MQSFIVKYKIEISLKYAQIAHHFYEYNVS